MCKQNSNTDDNKGKKGSKKTKYTLKDFAKIQFKGGKYLSRDIDKILYG